MHNIIYCYGVYRYQPSISASISVDFVYEMVFFYLGNSGLSKKITFFLHSSYEHFWISSVCNENNGFSLFFLLNFISSRHDRCGYANIKCDYTTTNKWWHLSQPNEISLLFSCRFFLSSFWKNTVNYYLCAWSSFMCNTLMESIFNLFLLLAFFLRRIPTVVLLLAHFFSFRLLFRWTA